MPPRVANKRPLLVPSSTSLNESSMHSADSWPPCRLLFLKEAHLEAIVSSEGFFALSSHKWALGGERAHLLSSLSQSLSTTHFVPRVLSTNQ